jgi:hypothetical protein
MLNLYRKAIILSVFLLPVTARPQTPANLEQLEAVNHPNKGCPENSDCDPEMGLMLDQWKRLVTRWAARPSSEVARELALVTNKRGWPSDFYARPAIKTTLSPALSDSACKAHRSNNPAQVLMRGKAFLKGVEKDEAIFVKKDTEFRLKLGEAVFLQPVHYFATGKTTALTYHLPLEEGPLYIQGDKMVSLIESEDFYSLLSVPTSGMWTFTVPPAEDVSQLLANAEQVKCPDFALALPIGFERTYCKTITTKDGKPAGVVQLFWSCN